MGKQEDTGSPMAVKEAQNQWKRQRISGSCWADAGQKIVSPNERVGLPPLFQGLLFSGTNFRPENTIQIQSKARFFRSL